MTKDKNWQHPDQKDGEVYIGYCTDKEFDFLFKVKFPGCRWGGKPYKDEKILRGSPANLQAIFIPQELYEKVFKAKLKAAQKERI